MNIIQCKNLGFILTQSINYCQLLSRRRNCRTFLLTINQLSSSASSQSNKTQISVSSEKKHQLSKDVKITERVKQTTKDLTNISVILAGIGVFGLVIYVVFKEFFSSKSPTSIFTMALKKCKNDPRIVELLGEPIKGHGEMTRRGRARHVSFVEYENNGKTFIRIKFYLKGSRNTATVQCETDKNSSKSHFRYLFVETDSYPSQVIIIEDNRLLDNNQQTSIS